MAFTGFKDESFEFFLQLAKNNNEDWFREHKDVYEEHVVTPLEELITELGPFFSKLDGVLAISDDVDDHLTRIDTGGDRTAATASFKTTSHCFFWNRELKRLHDAHFFVGLSAEGASMGFAIYDPGRASRGLKRIGEVFLPRIENSLDVLDNYIKASHLRRGFEFHRYVRATGRLGIREADAFPARPSEWSNTLGWVANRQIARGNARLQPAAFLGEVRSSFARLYPLYVFSSDTRATWKRRMKPPASA